MSKTAWTQDRSPVYLVGVSWCYGNWDLRCFPILSWVGQWASRLGWPLAKYHALWRFSIVWSWTMKGKSPKPTSCLVALTHKQAQISGLGSCFLQMTIVIQFTEKSIYKPLKHKHLWQIAWNAKFWAMLVTPGHYTIAIRNHALRLSWLANLKVSKFLIFPHQTHQTLPKKLRANKQPTTFDNMYKYLKWLKNSVLIARGGPFLFGNRVCQFNEIYFCIINIHYITLHYITLHYVTAHYWISLESPLLPWWIYINSPGASECVLLSSTLKRLCGCAGQDDWSIPPRLLDESPWHGPWPEPSGTS